MTNLFNIVFLKNNDIGFSIIFFLRIYSNCNNRSRIWSLYFTNHTLHSWLHFVFRFFTTSPLLEY